MAVGPIKPRFAMSDEFGSALTGLMEDQTEIEQSLGRSALKGSYGAKTAQLQAETQLAARNTAGGLGGFGSLLEGALGGIGNSKWFKGLSFGGGSGGSTGLNIADMQKYSS